MQNVEKLKEVIYKVLELDKNREELEKYLWSLDEKLVYELYAVYYCGRDGKIELSRNEDFEYNLNCLIGGQINDLIKKIKGNIALTRFLPKGMELLNL